MSRKEVKTFEWKCDSCGRRVLTQGFDAEDSRPEEMGVRRQAIGTESSRLLDVCNHCWETVCTDERLLTPAILLVSLRAS